MLKFQLLAVARHVGRDHGEARCKLFAHRIWIELMLKRMPAVPVIGLLVRFVAV